ncbi:MAG: VWA domain-containing protein [Polyangiaceae bacterium]|nr:VWA domain-containing protein [Polyangiaceae bacterium]
MNNKRGILRVLLITLSLCLVGAVVVYVLKREPPPTAAAPIQARLELATGDVKVSQAGAEERGSSGMALLSQAKVVTGKGARALVRLPDGSSMFLRGDSDVTLDDGQLTLGKGEYWLNAPPTDRSALVHQVGDVSVSAVDSGLSVKLQDSAAVVYVARGMAIVTGKGGRVEVNAGEQATVKGADAPRVAPLAFWDDWTGGMADFAAGGSIPGAGTGTIYGVDDGAAPGSTTRKLEIAKQAVRAVVRNGLSETEVDQTFFNPGSRDVEGWYWFTLPSGASVTGFAVETNGVLIEGEFQEKKEAAQNYGTAKATGHSPAILEWVDQSTYRARIYPVLSGKTRRVVLRYIELKPVVENVIEYVYPMGRGEPVRIGEFSLSVDLGKPGESMKIATLADARVEQNGRKITMRRSGFTPRADFQLEATDTQERAPLRVSRFKAGGETADYLMARYTPDIDWSAAEQPPADVVVVVDTSAAGDEASRQLKAQTAEAILRAMSDTDHFALVSVDVRPTVLHPKEGLAAANDKEIAKALEALAEHSSGGATDLASSFDVSLKRLHGTAQPAVVYVGDGVATSGEMTGEQLIERLRRALTTSRSRLFTVAVGAESDRALLGELARAGGGAPFRVEESDQTTAQALELLASIKLPTLTDFEIDLGAGLDEPFVSNSGKVSKGQEVVVLARSHHEIPSEIKVKGQFAGKPFEKSYPVKQDDSVIQAFVPRLWAAEYVRRLLGSAQGAETEQGRIAALGLEYGLMTPYSSILALESESAYSRMGIERKKRPLRGVRLGMLSPDQEWRLSQTLAAPGVPQVAMGCSKLERSLGGDSEQSAPASAPPEEDRQGGTGTRAKGDEGSMGRSNGTTSNRYGVRGPSDEPEPEAPAQAAPLATSLAEAKEEEAEKKPNDSDDEADGVLRAPAAAKPASGQGFAGGGKAAPLGNIGRIAKDGDDLKQKRDQPARSRQELDKLQDASEFGLIGLLGSSGFKEGRKDGWGGTIVASTCSDSSERPLAQRVLLWKKRISTARSSSDLINRYRSAFQACELKDWRSERAFLELLQAKVDTPEAANTVLGFFRPRPDVQKFVAKLILRRSVNPALTNAVEQQLFGNRVSWLDVDRQLSEITDLEKRIAKLKEIMARAPEDPNGDIRLVKLLSLAGHKDEALAHGRRLRDRGFITPQIARKLGDVLARAKLDAEAVRTYSEIVEFDPESAPSRLLLGDIYLSHGWYAPAYRQYKTLGELQPNSPLGELRLAAAAAGAGRVDESLRIQRQVASAEGTPGPNDPRLWARLWSAARLARLMVDPPPPTPGQPEVDPARRKANIERKLKELQLFSGEGTLVILTWEDLTATVQLMTLDGKAAIATGDVTRAAPVGLSSALIPNSDYARLTYEAQLMSELSDDPIGLVRQDITWDGKSFSVKVTKHSLEAREQKVGL